MQERDATFVLDILESAKIALSYVEGMSWDDFYESQRDQDAVLRRIEIIGEAARRVSVETQAEYPNIPWREMTSMRNLVIHEYDIVDLGQVWDTVKENLPPLIEKLSKILPPA
ncbi:MAG: DUF86 domain-containing protein [Chloroflexi bacterium]|nr:DUF86 domain-containing protein [Chloroflexota bacterium]